MPATRRLVAVDAGVRPACFPMIQVALSFFPALDVSPFSATRCSSSAILETPLRQPLQLGSKKVGICLTQVDPTDCGFDSGLEPGGRIRSRGTGSTATACWTRRSEERRGG